MTVPFWWYSSGHSPPLGDPNTGATRRAPHRGWNGFLDNRAGAELPGLVGAAGGPTGDRWEDVSERWLAVEVSGRGSRIYDREYKRNAYLALGVREVWLVDLQMQRIFVSRPGTEEDRPHDLEVVWTSPGSGRELRVDVAELFRGVRRGE